MLYVDIGVERPKSKGFSKPQLGLNRRTHGVVPTGNLLPGEIESDRTPIMQARGG